MSNNKINNKKSPKQIIEKIVKEISKEIEKKKKGKYSPMDYSGAGRIVERLNAKPRFIIELIQNADDNTYNVQNQWIKFNLTRYQNNNYGY